MDPFVMDPSPSCSGNCLRTPLKALSSLLPVGSPPASLAGLLKGQAFCFQDSGSSSRRGEGDGEWRFRVLDVLNNTAHTSTSTQKIIIVLTQFRPQMGYTHLNISSAVSFCSPCLP